MSQPRLFPLLLLLAALAPGRLAAQQWTRDTTERRLDWGSVDVLIGADTTAGVRIWAETSSLGYHGKAENFVSRFDPAGMKPWLDRAHFIVTYRRRPAPRYPGEALATPPLVAVDGSQLQLVRLRKKSKWDNHANLIFRRPDGSKPWAIRTSLKEAEAFIEALFAQASRSRRIAGPMLVRELNPFLDSAVSKPPRLVKAVEPHFPPGPLSRGRGGQVWLSFVVLENGSVAPGSFRALSYDNPDFVDAAVAAIAQSQFAAGTVGGEPVPSLVELRVVFKVAR